jgi:hypothetical protein
MVLSQVRKDAKALYERADNEVNGYVEASSSLMSMTGKKRSAWG